MDFDFLILLVAACLAVNLTPGPSIILVSSISAAKGFQAAFMAILGMSTGALVHVFLAASGIAALLATSPISFKIVQYLGAAYLIYLGIDLIRSKPDATHSENAIPVEHWQYFKRGFLVDLLNPKIALFFLAFLPQFLTWLESPGFLLSMGLGSVFLITGIIVNTTIAFLVYRGVDFHRRHSRHQMTRWIPGSILILLGIRLFWEKT
ncbi:MAG: LysE family translocator [Pseudomonadota bacterium]